jgi:uncharacterized protein YjlB
MAPVTVIHYLQEQEGIHLEVKVRKVAWGAVWRRSIVKFFEHFEGFSEHGIFHGILICPRNKQLIIKGKNGIFTIEWE